MNKSNDINIQKKAACTLLLAAILGPGCYKAEKYNNNQTECNQKRQEQICIKLKEILDSLTVTEKSVLTARFGLKGEKKTYSEIATLKGISEERVREIEAIALRKMRHISRSRSLRDFVNATTRNDDENENDVMNDADSIDHLKLNIRTLMPLKRAGITTITKLKNLTIGELILIKGMIPKTCSEILIRLMEYETV